MSSDASRIMRWASCVMLFLLFLSSVRCSDMAFYRARSDYFPLIPGSRWTYDVGGNTAVDSVVGDSAVAGQACVVVLCDYAPGYWTRQATEIRRYLRLLATRGGQEYLLLERFGLAYALPFVEGATWGESFRDTVVLMGTDTVLVKDSIFGRVAAIEDIQTPAGTFIQCYRIEIHHEVQAAEQSFTADYIEWLAPGVGMVKRRDGAEEKVLTEYRPGH